MRSLILALLLCVPSQDEPLKSILTTLEKGEHEKAVEHGRPITVDRLHAAVIGRERRDRSENHLHELLFGQPGIEIGCVNKFWRIAVGSFTAFGAPTGSTIQTRNFEGPLKLSRRPNEIGSGAKRKPP